MTWRIGIVGAGYWGDNLLRVFAAQPDVHIRRVADRDPARRQHVAERAPVAGDAEAIWGDPQIDAVVVATPPSTHAELARQVLLAGKHCWVEKPLALRTREARDLVDLARDRARVLFVDETFLYDPLVKRARQWVNDRLLGAVHHLSFERLSLGRVRLDSDIWWNAAPHDLSLLNYLVPAEVDEIRLERFAYLQPGIADVCVATLRLAGGISAHMYLSWLSPVKAGRAVVVGSQGMLVYDGRFGERCLTRYAYAIADPDEAQGSVVPVHSFVAEETVRGGSEEPLSLAAAAFIDCIRTGSRAPSEGTYSLRVVELLERGDLSVRGPGAPAAPLAHDSAVRTDSRRR